MPKYEIDINLLDVIKQAWEQETKRYSCAYYDEEEDKLFYTSERDDPQSSWPIYVKAEIHCSPKRTNILKGLWLLKENLEG